MLFRFLFAALILGCMSTVFGECALMQSPAYDAYVASPVHLYWASASGASSYEVQIGMIVSGPLHPEFKILIDTIIPYTSFNPKLNRYINYWWRVKSFSASCWSYDKCYIYCNSWPETWWDFYIVK